MGGGPSFLVGSRRPQLEKRYHGDSATPFSTTRIDWTYDAIGRLTQEHRDEGDDGFGVDGLPDAGDFIHTILPRLQR